MKEGIRRNPPIYLLFTAVGFGVGLAGYFGWHAIRTDPHLLLVNKKTNPHPWLSVDQGTNIKLYSINQKFDKNVKKGYHDDL
ncbi:hypothetical protein BCR33DRAFT_789383 [Rhizoclosmatium globosum]|uniref:NADH-ubiquinone reductase complex 1 MLRQ subunit n=1 Tax=Rhizoclosmatium globosum TaxID=329046 RepID=A0A1Y2BT97_9FUNG|nr:hypothetical protein HDU79_006199 [Rhizoclosmatium sp. JEL0117]ORY37978.1 hypothetical protein BCR33DRAFT_789383 [Rhizoclosmatium globosum]|eukprot:ORY37978.1 hypothetical protein BCR33DRAFT_789383 [Rhizoclosmatium globosum]